jgi:hypothetical protein
MNTPHVSEYWTAENTAALNKISSFAEMVPVGVSILEKMAASGNRNIVQLCGPMSTGGRGFLEANMAYFKEAMRIASEKGLHIFDQLPFQEVMIRLGADWETRQEYCTDILHVFYRGIFKSGLIKHLLFLPDWQSSTGARWEREEGKALGLTISDYPPEWLRLIK